MPSGRDWRVVSGKPINTRHIEILGVTYGAVFTSLDEAESALQVAWQEGQVQIVGVRKRRRRSRGSAHVGAAAIAALLRRMPDWALRQNIVSKELGGMTSRSIGKSLLAVFPDPLGSAPVIGLRTSDKLSDTPPTMGRNRRLVRFTRNRMARRQTATHTGRRTWPPLGTSFPSVKRDAARDIRKKTCSRGVAKSGRSKEEKIIWRENNLADKLPI